MIDESSIRRLTAKARIEKVVADYVPSLRKNGRAFNGLCPFHQEKTPSFSVNPERGFYHCFGCGAHGGVVDFEMAITGADFRTAVMSLSERFGVDIEETGDTALHAVRRDELRKAVELARAFFRERVSERPCLEELERRGIDPRGDVASAFGVGYAPSGQKELAMHLAASGVSLDVAMRAGLVSQSQSGAYYDRFRDRVVCTIHDPAGRPVGFSGRYVGPDGDRAPKYLNSPETELFAKSRLVFGLHQARKDITEQRHVILVEGNFDVLTLHERGMRNVVAPLGTAFTAEQAAILARSAESCVVMFDGDSAGRAATLRAAKELAAVSLASKVAILPDGADPDSLARDVGVSAVRAYVTRSSDMFQHLVDTILGEPFVTAGPAEKSARVRRVLELVNSHPDALSRALCASYAEAITLRLGLRGGLEEVRRSLEQAALSARSKLKTSGPSVDETTPTLRSSPAKPGEAWSEAVISVFVEVPHLVSKYRHLGEFLRGRSVVVMAAIENALDGDRLNVRALLDSLQGQERRFVAWHIADPQIEDAAEAEDIINSVDGKLEIMHLKEALASMGNDFGNLDVDTELCLLEAAHNEMLRKWEAHDNEMLGHPEDLLRRKG